MTDEFDPFDEPGLADRYLRGEASEAECAMVVRWEQRETTRTSLLAAMRAGLSDAGTLRPPQSPATRIDSALARVMVGAHAPMKPVVRGSIARKSIAERSFVQQQISSWITRGVAAAAVITAAVLAWPHRAPHPAGSPAARYTTKAGQLATIPLPDGSHVVLAPGSELTVAADFGAHRRDVTLRGEAYFDVIASQRTPFTVHTARGASMRVLGTAFDVRAYSESESDVRVVVSSGRVRATTRRGAETIVAVGTIAHLTDSTVATTTGDAVSYTSWTNGTLVFDEAPIGDVLTALSQWYGMRFRVADSSLVQAFAHGSLTARFNAHSSADAMTLLKTALRVTLTFDRRNDTTIVTLHARSAHDDVQTRPASPGTDPHGADGTVSIHREVGR